MLPQIDTRQIARAAGWRSEYDLGAPVPSAESFWPLELGDWWNLQGPDREPPLRFEVVRKNGGWSKIEGFCGARWWWLSRTGPSAWYWDLVRLSYQMGFDLAPTPRPSPARRTLTDRDLEDRLFVVSATGVTLDTAFGVFEGCVVLEATRTVEGGRAIEQGGGWREVRTANRVPAVRGGAQATGGEWVLNRRAPPTIAGLALAPGFGPIEAQVRGADGQVRTFRTVSTRNYAPR